MILRLFLRLLGIDNVIQELASAVDRLETDVRGLSRVVDELSAQVAEYEVNSVSRQKVMRDELMESEARMMNQIEELQEVKAAPPEDTLEVENKRPGYVRWTERKRSRAAAAADSSKWTGRFKDGYLQGAGRQEQNDLRRGNDQSGDGQTQVSQET